MFPRDGGTPSDINNITPTMSMYDRCALDNPDASMDAMIQCFADQRESYERELTVNLLHWFLVLAGSIVFSMQVGFAMICAGCVRKKNLQNTMLKNMLDACGAAISFYMIGYGLAFGGQNEADSKTFAGHKGFFGIDDINPSFWFFQFACSATTTTIVAGTLAERCQMIAYLLYSVFLSGLVYPIVAHAMWSTRGVLSIGGADPWDGIGALDFAGSGVVHVTGGCTALIATYILGPRAGRFYDPATGKKLAQPKEFIGHSESLQMLGTLMLWFGWYGFNPGSAMLRGADYDVGRIAARAAINTSLAAAGGAIGALGASTYREYRRRGEYTYHLVSAMNGLLTGCVAITAGCGTMTPWPSLITGVIAGWLYLLVSAALPRFELDDVVDAIPVHFAGGAWGLIAAGLFTAPTPLYEAFHTREHVGLIYSWGQGEFDIVLLWHQIVALCFIIGWTTVMVGPFFYILNHYNWLRTEKVVEMMGLDHAYHGGLFDEDGNEQLDRTSQLLLQSLLIKKNQSSEFKPTASMTSTTNNGNANANAANNNNATATKVPPPPPSSNGGEQ